MRRVILAVFAGGTLLTAGACGDDPKPAQFAGPATTAASAPTESVVPSASVSPSFDYTADNNKVCKRLDTTISFGDFGAALGKMIANKEAKQTADAEKAETAAATALKTVATKIRKEAAAAKDPQLKQAAVATAAKIEASAKNRDYLESVKTTKDLNTPLKEQINAWLAPVSGYCGTVPALPDATTPAPSGSVSVAPSASLAS
ncbi:hypothetical protein [Actinoplanes utahensis]|uniref:hypothetical protein n=1 Tax=Actinoplanes utahensis TaxID=1869 RepID=UPI0007C7DB8B|nr:hypothetical protein [Actinoplanes utahensis]GIF29436.1 hypothetical protein Aut01nite_24220 [Actinoplanes utahensis]